MIIQTLESPTGALYELHKVPYGYQWVSKGSTSKSLSGLFVELNDALRAADRLKNSFGDEKARLKYEPTPQEELDKLTKKEELLHFAKLHNIEVPPALSRPTQIKKMLKEEL